MKTPISWLKDFVNIDIKPETLADKLVSAGFEVEEIIYQKDNIKNIVAGRILEIEKHQNSDHLLICQVDVGTEKLQIVTGAHNIKVGDIVPVCKHGAKLPSGQRIYEGELRGVKSNGMFCGGSELNLTDDDYPNASFDGILILKPDVEIGMDINDVIGNNDVILDIDVTANRPDCNSIIGIAREIAAVLKVPFKEPEINFTENENEKIKDLLKLDIQNETLCPHYIAKAVKDIKICKSPKIIRDRLKAVGINPINNIVDITNYLLIEIGQPMHSFDYKNIKGQTIIVRNAKDGEAIVTLDEAKNKLDNTMLVIADNERPLAVAGVMGGINSGITDKTNTIIFESAKFARDNIRRTARTLNLHSDSSARFEKGIDFMSQSLAIKRALTIIQKYNWGTIVGGVLDSVPDAVHERTVKVPCKKINEILGIKVPSAKMADILNNLQIKTTVEDRILKCVIPAYRDDIENANDLAEEIIRMHGYKKIKSTLLNKAQQTRGGREVSRTNTDTLKNALAMFGGNEIITYSFISPKAFDMLRLDENDKLRKAIKIKNPLGEDVSIMRTTLVHSMISTMASNLAKNNKNATLFEVAKAFIPKELPLTEFPTEIETLSIGQYGEDKDFFTLKGIVEKCFARFAIDEPKFERIKLNYLHDGRSAEIFVKGESVGYMGEVHPDVAENYGINNTRLYVAEINLDALYKYVLPFREFKAIPKYPAMVRDLALIVKETISAEQVISVIKKIANNLENVEVFDVYKGEGVPKNYVSLALKLTFRNPDRTLKEVEVNDSIDHILRSLNRKYRVKLRK